LILKTGVLYYKNNSGVLVNTSLNWSQPTDSLIQTEDSVNINSNLIISGNLTVNGTTVTVNTETVVVEDNIMVLNVDAARANIANDKNSGIEVERGSLTNVQLIWNESVGKWQFTNDGTNYVNINENVSSANSWSTARTITLSGDATGSVSIDGTQNVTLGITVVNDSHDHTASTLTFGLNDATDVTISSPANGSFLKYVENQWTNDSVVMGTDTVGNYVESLVAGTGITLTNGAAAEGGTPTIAVTENTYDAHGAAAAAQSAAIAHANTVSSTAYSNAVTYVNNRVLNDISDVAISDTLANGDFLRYNGDVWINDPVNLSTDTVGNYVQSLIAGTGITLTNATAAEGGTPTIAVTTYTFDAYGAAAAAQAAAEASAAAALSNHESDTTNVHGIANTALLSTLVDLSNHATSTNVHGISDTAALVTLTGNQTLTNKTLTSPSITGISPTITLDGDLSGDVTLTNLSSATLTASISSTFEYIRDITAGTNIVLTDDSAGINSNRIYSISTSATPNFTSVSTAALSIDGIEIDPTGVTNGQILKYNSTINKFIASDDLAESAQAGAVTKYTETFYGNGTLKTVAANHNLNSTNVIVQIIDTNSKETIEGHVVRTGVNSITATFQTPIPNNGYTIIVIG